MASDPKDSIAQAQDHQSPHSNLPEKHQADVNKDDLPSGSYGTEQRTPSGYLEPSHANIETKAQEEQDDKQQQLKEEKENTEAKQQSLEKNKQRQEEEKDQQKQQHREGEKVKGQQKLLTEQRQSQLHQNKKEKLKENITEEEQRRHLHNGQQQQYELKPIQQQLLNEEQNPVGNEHLQYTQQQKLTEDSQEQLQYQVWSQTETQEPSTQWHQLSQEPAMEQQQQHDQQQLQQQHQTMIREQELLKQQNQQQEQLINQLKQQLLEQQQQNIQYQHQQKSSLESAANNTTTMKVQRPSSGTDVRRPPCDEFSNDNASQFIDASNNESKPTYSAAASGNINTDGNQSGAKTTTTGTATRTVTFSKVMHMGSSSVPNLGEDAQDKTDSDNNVAVSSIETTGANRDAQRHNNDQSIQEVSTENIYLHSMGYITEMYPLVVYKDFYDSPT